MSLKDKFDQLSGSRDAIPSELLETPENENYTAPSHSRNLTFVQPDGKQTFLSYAFLIAGDFSPEESEIILTYTTHTVTLKGNNLETLFNALTAHKPKHIKAEEERYAEVKESNGAVVKEIFIQQI